MCVCVCVWKCKYVCACKKEEEKVGKKRLRQITDVI